MKVIEIKHLVTGIKLDRFIYHKSGDILHSPGETLTLEHLALLEECEITKVIILEPHEDAQVLKSKIQKKAVSLEKVHAGEPLPVTLYNAENTIIAEAGSVVRQELLSQLQTNGVKELYYQKDAQELENFQSNKYKSLLESDMFESLGSITELEHPLERERKALEKKKLESEESLEKDKYDFSKIAIDPTRLFANPAQEISTTALKKAMKPSPELRVAPSAPLLEKVVKRIIYEREDSVKESYQTSYMQWLKQLTDIFTRLKANSQVSYKEIDTLAKEILTAFALDGFYFLNLTNNRDTTEADGYVPSHCLNVACISAGMCAMLGFNATQTIEVIIGALMHDLGHMLTYRPFFTKESLDTSEQQKFDEHAPLGVAMIKNISAIPKSTLFIIYQHHERLDGSGRVLHCLETAIHDYAKLVGVADEFEILSRKKTPLAAINAILSLAKDKKLDIAYTRALLVSLSLYPLGSMVVISGNKVCKVIGTNGHNFKTPVVRALFSIQNNQLVVIPKKELIDLASTTNIVVERSITHPVLNKKIGIGF